MASIKAIKYIPVLAVAPCSYCQSGVVIIKVKGRGSDLTHIHTHTPTPTHTETNLNLINLARSRYMVFLTVKVLLDARKKKSTQMMRKVAQERAAPFNKAKA